MHRFAVVVAVVFACAASPASAQGTWTRVNRAALPSNGLLLAGLGVNGGLVVVQGLDNSQSNSRIFLLTAQNGTTFSERSLPQSFPPLFFGDFHLFDRQAWVGASPLGTKFTLDGGGSWGDYPADTSGLGTQVVRCIGTDCMFGASGSGRVGRVASGESSIRFTAAGFEGDVAVFDIARLDVQRAFAVGCEEIETGSGGQTQVTGFRNGRVVETRDGGATWTKLADAPTGECPRHVGVIDADTIVVAFSTVTNTELRKLRRGGQWESLIGPGRIAAELPGGFGPLALYTAATVQFWGQEGWIVVTYGADQCGPVCRPRFYYTNDGGATFRADTPQPEADGFTAFAAKFESPARGFVVGDYFTVYRFGEGGGPPPGDTDGDLDGGGDGEPADGTDGGPDTPVDNERVPGVGDPGYPGGVCASPVTPAAPECDPTKGASICLFDATRAFCTQPCNVDGQCGDGTTACCREVTLSASSAQKVCLYNAAACSGSGGLTFTPVEGKRLGEPCRNIAECGAVWGAELCLGIDAFPQLLCTKRCGTDGDCPGSNCCLDLGESGKFCMYGAAQAAICPGAVEPEREGGDADAPDGDAPADTDPAADADTGVEAPDLDGIGADRDTPGGSGATGGKKSGCRQAGASPLWLLAAALVALGRRRGVRGAVRPC